VNIFIVRCAVLGYIRLKSALVVCCGLLAKWLRVWVRVRAGDRECTNYTFFFLCSYKCSEHLGLVVRKYATVYLWFHVT